MDNDNGNVERFDSGFDNSSDEEVQFEIMEGGNPDNEIVLPVRSVISSTNQSEPPDEPLDTELHSYLGAELEVVRGRTVLEEGAAITLDMLQPADLVLVPGQTLPLTVFDPPTINMLRNCLRNDRTFGVVASWSDGRKTIINNTGTTAEIYEYLPEEGPAGFRVKAKARQRFKLMDSELRLFLDSQLSRWKAKVKILPEVRLPDPLEKVKLQSLYRHRTSPSRCQRFRRMDAAVTRWPLFVYEQYNVKKLISGIKKELANYLTNGQKRGEKAQIKVLIPDDPTDLSFWVAQNMPMREEHRLMLLKLNSPIQRLRWELQALQKCRQVFCCEHCGNGIAYSGDIFSMSAEGPQSTYVNPGGYLHETITLFKVGGVFSIGPPSIEFSWFPGYAWTISKCKRCKLQIGWKFIATKSNLKPHKFWGICRRSVSMRMGSVPERANDESDLLVF